MGLPQDMIQKELAFMAEMVLQARTLPEPLFRLIRTEKVKVSEDNNGDIRLTPLKEIDRQASSCPLLGLYKGGKLTVEQHIAWSREDKAREER